MADEQMPHEVTGPAMSYTSPFAPRPAATGAAAAEPEAAPTGPRRRGRLALAAGALVLLATAAAASGALIGHELWTSPATPSAAPDTGTSAPVQPPAAGNGNTGSATFGGNGQGSVTPNGSGGFSFNGGGASGSGGPANASALPAKVSPALVDINVSSSFRGMPAPGPGSSSARTARYSPTTT